jgi:HD-GYP domain-containing protein (c-di-GMP phosphodiesterase class II)
MPDSQLSIRFFDVVLCISRALDLVSPELSDHHHRVAFIAACLAEELGLGAEDRKDIVIAGALHDAGAISLTARLSLIKSCHSMHEHAGIRPGDDVHRHAFDGYRLLRDFRPFAKAATAIRFHHADWDFGRGDAFGEEPVPLASHILRLADNAAMLPQGCDHILNQAPDIRQTIREGTGRMYKPEIVQAFEQASARESFWLDMVNPHKEEVLRPYFGEHEVAVASDALYELATLFGKIIDYRSPFTVTHSTNVAEVAELLAELAGLPAQQKRIMGLAGYLHDLGKLAIPSEILDKPGRLTPYEELVVRQHPYHTYRILSMVSGLEEVAMFGAMHHERLDGSGYPFRSRGIPLGSRIVAVADVFSAVTEDRPYRAGMTWEESMAVLESLVSAGGLDGGIAALVRDNPGTFGEFVEKRERNVLRA